MADEELEKVIQECRQQFLAVLESGHTPDLAYFLSQVPRESQSRLLAAFDEIKEQSGNANAHSKLSSEKSGGSSENSLVGQILDRWEMAYERGEDLSPEELCANTPRLLNHVREKIDALRSLIDPLNISPGDSSVQT
jgi:hypothetical protein